MLEKSSFTSDLAIFSELDEIAGTTGTASYPRDAFVQFLKRKGWVIEPVAEAVDDSESGCSSPAPPLPGPNIHFIFPSTSSDSGSVQTSKGILLLLLPYVVNFWN